jgi:hypothetical protein
VTVVDSHASSTVLRTSLQLFTGVPIADRNVTTSISAATTASGGVLSKWSQLPYGAESVQTTAQAAVYTLSASSAAALTAALDALTLAPAANPQGQSVSINPQIAITDSAGATAVDSSPVVTDNETGSLPTINGTQSGQITQSDAPIDPFAHVVVSDANPGAIDTIRLISYTGDNSFTDGPGFSGLTHPANGWQILGMARRCRSVISLRRSNCHGATFDPSTPTPRP